MREIRLFGSEGGAKLSLSLPLSVINRPMLSAKGLILIDAP
jgi:hypothetical protein